MAYDLLLKNGRIIDGSGMPGFLGDVAVKHGKIAAMGKLSGSATRTLDASGMVIAPGFIDNHCHYDAQVLWDPLCSFSCYHGSTTVIFGNCSLGLAPAKPADRERLAGMLSYVEAIPMDVLQAGVPWTWATFPEYMQAVGQRLGVNAGILIPHSAVRYHAMGEASQEDQRPATPEQLALMQQTIREGMEAGALGMSITRNRNHFDLEGRRIAGACAPEDELFAMVEVLGELGTGVLQCGGGGAAELKDRLVSRLSAACGRRIMYNTITHNARAPQEWARHLAIVEESCQAGNQAMPLCTPNQIKARFTLHNCQSFRGLEHWHPILLSADAEKMQAYSDPAVRQQLKADLQHMGPNPVFSNRWDLMMIKEPKLPANQGLRGTSVAQLAAAQGKEPLDAFLDLGVAEHLDTVFELTEINVDPEAVAKILTSPYTVVGLSDGGAHVQFDSGVAFSTRLLGYWVREQQIMSLEEAIRQITFASASAFGVYDRGLLRPGLAADLVVFDATTINPLPEDIVHDFPNNGWRMRERATGIAYTIVNGTVLMEHGQHTGALPGRVLRHALYATA